MANCGESCISINSNNSCDDNQVTRKSCVNSSYTSSTSSVSDSSCEFENDHCNNIEYCRDSEWSKAFNKKTLSKQSKTVDLMLSGMHFNIEDARNTIAQIEQYLIIIHELLIASQDQVIKASSPSRTEADFDSASMRVREYMREMNKIVDSAQYNGRFLLQEADGFDSPFDSPNTEDIRDSICFRFAGPRGFVRNVGPTLNDFCIELPKVGPHALGLAGNNGGYINGRTTGNTSGNHHNYLENGLNDWVAKFESGKIGSPDDEGVIPLDLVSDDDIDATLTAFNNGVKIVGVELDKMQSYKYILCNREKQIHIYKEGQLKSFELRNLI